jgi:hypothetical protein
MLPPSFRDNAGTPLSVVLLKYWASHPSGVTASVPGDVTTPAGVAWIATATGVVVAGTRVATAVGLLAGVFDEDDVRRLRYEIPATPPSSGTSGAASPIASSAGSASTGATPIRADEALGTATSGSPIWCAASAGCAATTTTGALSAADAARRPLVSEPPPTNVSASADAITPAAAPAGSHVVRDEWQRFRYAEIGSNKKTPPKVDPAVTAEVRQPDPQA